MDAETRVRSFIRRNFVYADNHEIAHDESLMARGVVDSTGILELIDFIEEEFGVTLQDHDLVPENLDSISNIVRLLARKLTGSGRMDTRASEGAPTRVALEE